MNNSTNLILNRDAPPFDNPEIRKAHGAGARPQGVHRHHQPGQGRCRRHHAARPGRRVGHAARRCSTPCRATAPTSQKNRAEARAIMKKLGYGPDKPLKLKVSTRNICSTATPP